MNGKGFMKGDLIHPVDVYPGEYIDDLTLVLL